MTLIDRVNARLEALALSPIDAAKLAGLERNYVRDLIEGRKVSPRIDGLMKLAPILGRSVEWLLNGADEEGRRQVISIDEAERNGGAEIQSGVSSVTRYQGSRSGAMAEMDARAGAGNGDVGAVIALSGRGIETAHKVRAEWVFPVDFTRHGLGADPRTTIVLEVIGDSMRPTLEPGDRVLVDTSAEWRGDDAIWLIDDGAPKVKRLRSIRGSAPARVVILSDNTAVPPEEVDLSEIRVVGRVCGRVSRM